jgi:hypothetical protein
MKVYLDNCCFNRPFDGQDDIRIRLESEAKLEIQQMILAGKLQLVWSFILEFENDANPFSRRNARAYRNGGTEQLNRSGRPTSCMDGRGSLSHLDFDQRTHYTLPVRFSVDVPSSLPQTMVY